VYWENNYISIPYGAIKSQQIAVMVLAFKDISIPYGAIKSWFVEFACVHVYWISIPYGAIKRNRRRKKNGCFSIFQFLMVRLKESLHQIRRQRH